MQYDVHIKSEKSKMFYFWSLSHLLFVQGSKKHINFRHEKKLPSSVISTQLTDINQPIPKINLTNCVPYRQTEGFSHSPLHPDGT